MVVDMVVTQIEILRKYKEFLERKQNDAFRRGPSNLKVWLIASHS